MENLDLILENQDYIIYSRTSEKGDCKVIQCSNSIVGMFGYSKQEIIGKNIESLMPSIYQAEHYKNLSQKIKILRSSYNLNSDIFKNTDKKQFFVLPKTKVGYLLPINSRFKIYNEDDFSNTFIIRSKFEPKDTKSIYGYYILTKDDFTIDSITSSCLNLNLSMELLKKYVINMNYLIRSENLSEINLAERYSEYEEEPRRIVWIHPDMLYPKLENLDLSTKTEFEIEELIQGSQKKEMNLLISRIKFKDDEILGYCFRLTPTELRKQNQENMDIRLNFNSNKLLIYDMSKLNYSRSIIVNEKSKLPEPILFTVTPDEFINNKFKEENNDNSNSINLKKNEKKKKKRKYSDVSENSEEEEEEKHLEDNIITKEKLNELQNQNMESIRFYIDNLYDFGDQVAYFRKDVEFKNSYEDHYHKFSLMKQTMDLYTKKQTDKLANSLDRKSDKMKKSEMGNSIKERILSNELNSDAGSALNEIFNYKSITNIKYFSFFMFLILCFTITIEFFFSLNIINDCNIRISYSEKAFTILNGILYTKFFLTEAVIAQDPSYANIDSKYKLNNTNYIIDLMNEMSNYHQTISDVYSNFLNASITFSDEYNHILSNTYVYQRTLSNGVPSSNIIPFSSTISTVIKN